MAFGDETIQLGDRGPDVVELQLRLSGFQGTVWDGVFGPGTERQVKCFQNDVMKMQSPSGVFDRSSFDSLKAFANAYPVNFAAIQCPCGDCPGFGQSRFAGEYRAGKPHIEAYHNREYPGIHKAILHTYRAACFYLHRAGFPKPFLTSGYRCWIHNDLKGRKSTNHMGKALDFDMPRLRGEDKSDDAERCDSARRMLEQSGLFQVGWNRRNTKAFEPPNIAPTWVHMDVRCYASRYLADECFVRDERDLDS